MPSGIYIRKPLTESQREQLKKMLKKRWDDLKQHEKATNKLIEAWKDPIKREKRIKTIKNNWTLEKRKASSEEKILYYKEHPEKNPMIGKIGEKHQNFGKHWKVKDTSNMKGCQNAKGAIRTEESKEKQRKWCLEHPSIKNHKENCPCCMCKAKRGDSSYITYPSKDTAIEIKLQKELEKRNIIYKKQKQMFGRPDIFIEPNICIFADGCYWHGCQEHCINSKFSFRINKDKNINEELNKQGYIVYRFWEHDINRSVEECINKIIEIK